MIVHIEILPAKYRYAESTWYSHKQTRLPSKKPLLLVTWVQNNGSEIAQVSTIEMIFDPIKEYVTIPEEVRLEIIKNYKFLNQLLL